MTFSSRLADVRRLASDLFYGEIRSLPGPSGYRLRYWYWKSRLRHLGDRVTFETGVSISGASFVSIGDDTLIDRDVSILAGPDSGLREARRIQNQAYEGERGEVIIGARTHVAPNVILSGRVGLSIGDDCGIAAGAKLYSLSHHFRSDDRPDCRSIKYSPKVPVAQQFMVEGPVVVSSNCGISVGAVILPGVFIGEDSFVLANAVVTKGFPSNSILAGFPAAQVGQRYRPLVT